MEDPLNNYYYKSCKRDTALVGHSLDTRCDVAFRWKTGIRRCQFTQFMEIDVVVTVVERLPI